MLVPENPKIYHIVHWDRLASIIKDGHLLADIAVSKSAKDGTTIGMSRIKQRRLGTPIKSHPGLRVGECVPFYFCPRSIMLFMLHKGNSPDLNYSGGQEPIVHLVADFHKAIEYASKQKLRWAFTKSNAASSYFLDFCAKEQLEEINWLAMNQTDWRDASIKEAKQAEFLMEQNFSWNLIERIGVSSGGILTQVNAVLNRSEHMPQVGIEKSWYY
jgi:hypothetical protein